jgi:hypothetical protein
MQWGTRKPRTTRTPSKPSGKPSRWGTKKSRYYSNRKKLPSRYYQSSKRQYYQTKAATNALRQISETHLVPLKEYNQEAAEAIAPNDNVYQIGFTTGVTHEQTGVPAYLSTFKPLGGFNFPSNVRGNNIYVRGSQVMLQIDMDVLTTSMSVCEFRVIMFKSKRANSTMDRLNPNQNLFLNTEGGYWGWATGGAPTSYGVGTTGPKLMTALTNKQKFTIYRDQTFKLSPPQALYDENSVPTFQHQSSGYYPSMKRLKFNFPVNKKVTLDTDNNPIDLNYAFNIIILARPLAGLMAANDFKVSTMNGVTTFTDF